MSDQNSDVEEKGSEIAVLDLETDPFRKGRIEITPFVAGFYDGKETIIFWGADCCMQLVKRLKKCKPGTIVYAHNGGNFDFHFLLEFLPVNDCEFLCMGKRIVQIKLPWGVELRDSYAIIPKKLATYGKTKINYDWFERPVREKHREVIISYLKDDLRNNREMVIGFFKRFPAKITLASSVFHLMKTEFGYNPGRSSPQYDAKFRPFFFGGRVQFWKLGELKGKFSIVDINSAYPAAMVRDHWFNFESDASGIMPKRFREQSFYVIDCHSKRAFPLRQKNGSIEFPDTQGRYFVSGWELLAAQDLGLITDLKILCCFTPKELKSMRNFSETLYHRKNKAKQEGDKEEEFFNKIAINAGYGKMALNPTRYSEVKVTTLYDQPDRWDGKQDKKDNPDKPEWELCWHDTDRELSFWKRSSYREGIDKFINVATAASITGCARAFLQRSISICKDVVYCDTDSLIAGDTSRLKFSDKLGDWKLELKIDTSKIYEYEDKNGKIQRHRSGLWIAGKKLYAAFGLDESGKAKWKTACKGVSLSSDKIIEVASGRYIESESIAPTYSLFTKPKFVSREVKRSDMPKRPKKKIAKDKDSLPEL